VPKQAPKARKLTKMDSKKTQPEAEDQPTDESRPPLGSWPRMYALVLGNLVILIVIFYAFTRVFD
jgi:hypothetical protein